MLIDALKFLATVSVYGITFVILMIIFIFVFRCIKRLIKIGEINNDHA